MTKARETGGSHWSSIAPHYMHCCSLRELDLSVESFSGLKLRMVGK
jgi:hypothetical protein